MKPHDAAAGAAAVYGSGVTIDSLPLQWLRMGHYTWAAHEEHLWKEAVPTTNVVGPLCSGTNTLWLGHRAPETSKRCTLKGKTGENPES